MLCARAKHDSAVAPGHHLTTCWPLLAADMGNDFAARKPREVVYIAVAIATVTHPRPDFVHGLPGDRTREFEVKVYRDRGAALGEGLANLP